MKKSEKINLLYCCKIVFIFFVLVMIGVKIKAQNAKQPNILFIQCDQFRYDCQGKLNSMVETPNTDRITNEGMFFTNAYKPIPTYYLTRQTFLSGKWPEQHKGLWNYDITLPVALFDEHTWTDDMRKDGYNQAYAGKWHVHPTKSPLDFGFDKYVAETKYQVYRIGQNLPPTIPIMQEFTWIGGLDPAPL